MESTHNKTYLIFALMSVCFAIVGAIFVFPVSIYMRQLYLPHLVIFFIITLVPIIGLVLAILSLIKSIKAIKNKLVTAFSVLGIFLSILVLPLLIFLSIDRISGYRSSKIIDIPDVTNATSFLLSKEGKNDYGVIYVDGYIDGTATISIWDENQRPLSMTLNPSTFSPNTEIRKKVSIEFKTEIYRSECSLKYEPRGVSSGHLKIRYDFCEAY